MNITGFGTEWVESLKEKMASLSTSPNSRLWIVADAPNGTLGLVNCLKQEDFGDQIR